LNKIISLSGVFDRKDRGEVMKDYSKKIKVVFFDVDGTLLSHKLNDVPLSTQIALQKLRSRGILTVVATGRSMIEFSQLPVGNLDFDGYLMLNGQLLMDRSKSVYAGTSIDEGEMKVLVRIFNRKKIPFMLIGADKRYINYVDDAVIRTQTEVKGTIPDVGEYQGEKIYQILAFVPDEEKKVLEELLDECKITQWNDTGIDIIPKGGGKSVGIQQFLAEKGLDRSEIMAFGDGENDIDMLQFAGIGVAMGNANDTVKAAADYVTDSVDENGIENALKHFGLID
jgi:hypothetical protein